jgi:carnitine O-acetyltransferase
MRKDFSKLEVVISCRYTARMYRIKNNFSRLEKHQYASIVLLLTSLWSYVLSMHFTIIRTIDFYSVTRRRFHTFRSFWNGTYSRIRLRRISMDRRVLPSRVFHRTIGTLHSKTFADEEDALPSPYPPTKLALSGSSAVVSYFDSFGDYQKDEEMLRKYFTGKELSTEEVNKQPVDALPLLPIPSLADSLALLKHSVVGLGKNEEERSAFLLALQKASTQLLPMYHEQLLKRGQHARDHKTSWLQRWWNTRCYLQVRSPNVIHSSYFFRFPHMEESGQKSGPSDDHRLFCKTALEKATLVVYAALQYSLPIVSGDGMMPPVDSLPKETAKTEPPKLLCSAQYKYLFGTSRIPGATSDTYRLYQFSASPSLSQLLPHVTVVCRGQFFNVVVDSVAKNDDGEVNASAVLSSIFRQLVAIVNYARSVPRKGSSISGDASNRVPELGWLTTQPRDDWYDDYQFLLKNEPMRDALHTLQSSLFLLCLDDAPIARMEEDSFEVERDFALRLWNGARGGDQHVSQHHHHVGGNRWYDKTIQIVMTLNEANEDNDMSFGVIGEHSMADGMPVAEFSRYLSLSEYQPQWNVAQFFRSIDDNVETAEMVRSENAGKMHSVRNIFQDAFASMTTREKEQLHARVREARAAHIDATDQYELQIFDSTSLPSTNPEWESIGLGSHFLKTMRISPDAGVQMILQLAAYRYFDETTVATYESTHTRQFQHGRTETIRSVSQASRKFCRAFTEAMSQVEQAASQNEHTSVKDLDRSRQQKLMELFGIACDAHAAYSRLASNGRGCDRHLFALEILAHRAYEEQLREETAQASTAATSSRHSPTDLAKLIRERTIPVLFQDPVYQRAKRWRLSTSTLPSTAPGFGPVVPDGFGIGYDIGPQHVIYTITVSRAENDARRFRDALAQATMEVQELLNLAFERGEHLEPRRRHDPKLVPSAIPRKEPISAL